jgi:hypothetical protein
MEKYSKNSDFREFQSNRAKLATCYPFIPVKQANGAELTGEEAMWS